MQPEPTIRAGVLVVRAWREADSPEGFRARIMGTPDVRHPAEVTERVAATPEQVSDAVAAWLAAFARATDAI